MTKRDIKMVDAYSMYKSMWPRPSVPRIAEAFQVSQPAVYQWIKTAKLNINGVEYVGFKAALEGETKELRETYEKEISDQIKESYKLSEIWANEIMKKAIIRVKKEEYEPTLDEIKLAILIHEKQQGRLNGEVSGNDITGQNVNFKISFRGDKVGDLIGD